MRLSRPTDARIVVGDMKPQMLPMRFGGGQHFRLPIDCGRVVFAQLLSHCAEMADGFLDPTD